MSDVVAWAIIAGCVVLALLLVMWVNLKAGGPALKRASYLLVWIAMIAVTVSFVNLCLAAWRARS